MSDIFLSYNRQDQDRARNFATALEALGHSVWWDVGLKTGEAYDEVTENALRNAKAVIVMWSPRSAASRWVRAEATLALRNKTLFPCMIEPCDRPIMFELTQTADLSHWRGDPEDPVWRVFAADLERFIETGARPDGAPEKAPDRFAARLAGAPAAPVAPAARGGFGVDRRAALIAGGAGLAIIAGGALLFSTRGPSLAENGVAVLPFRNLSGDASRDYLSAGLAVEVRAVLARNNALRVVAQASSEAVRQRALDAAGIAKALAVSYLLDGNVNVTGDRLRVSAELIDGRTGFSRWSQLFEHPLAELSTIQNAIAQAVTQELSVGDDGSPEDGAYGETRDPIAYDHYLRGNELYTLATDLESDLAALAAFDRAIARDPSFGAAHASRARSLTSLGNTADNVAAARDYYASASVAARRAVDLGPQSADAHSTLGFVLFQAQLKVADAREAYEASVRFGPGDAPVQARYGLYCAATRRPKEAREAILRARDLDPLNATIHRAVGFVHYAAGEYGPAIRAVEKALELNPKLADSHARIAMSLIGLGRPDEARAKADAEPSGMMRYPAVAISARRLGDEAGADEANAALVDHYGDAGLYQQAQILAAWGRADEAIAVLEKAYEFGDSGLTYAYIDPTLDGVRERPEFQALLKRLGFI